MSEESNIQLKLPEYVEAQKIIDILQDRLREAQVVSMTVILENADGTMGMLSTRNSNVFAMFGYTIAAIMERMGFVRDRGSMTKKDVEGDDDDR